MPRSLRDVRTSYTYQPSARLHHCTYGVRVAASGVSHVVTANRATTGHRTSGMPGKITRLLACSAEQRRRYPERGMQMGPTFVHENFVDNPHTHGEKSGSYNKPAAVMFWTQQAKIQETFVLYIDADMLLRAPLDPVAMGARRGMVVSEHVGYLEQGIRNKLVRNFVPAEAVPLARAAGWYHIFHVEDLRTIAPRWLHYTEQMRTHPERYWAIARKSNPNPNPNPNTNPNPNPNPNPDPDPNPNPN